MIKNLTMALVATCLVFSIFNAIIFYKHDNHLHSNTTIYIENTDTIWTEKQGWYLSNTNAFSMQELKELIYEFHIGYYDLIDSIAKANNKPTEAVVARAIRESRFNTTKSSVEDYNLFGIHYTSSMKKKYKFRVYTDRDDKGRKRLYKFVKYESYSEAIQHFCEIISLPRYVKHLKENNLNSYAYALCEGGYSAKCDPKDDINAWRYYNSIINSSTNIIRDG